MKFKRLLTGMGRAVFISAVLALLCANLFAQSETATVLGTVKDKNGAVVKGANVTLKNTGTTIAVVTQTDSDGDYQFTNVKIGTYQITVESSGFNKTVAENINLVVNARQRVDLTLEVATANATVTITDAAEVLETDSSVRGQVIQRTQIVALPLNGRSYANLALLAPGVRESNSNDTTGSGGREAAFNVNGLRATVNNFLLDGIDNNAYGTSNQSFSSQVIQISPDAIAEFKVQTNTYSAEFGRAGGAVINATYRSGTNQFHGSLWEFHRNTVLNAVGFFKPAGGVKPPLLRNQFGFAVGGPIIKDRTFFFGDYEGFRQISKSVQFSTLPTVAQRQGILAIDVRDPLTGSTYTAGTAIPMTAFAQKVLNELPLPNVASANGANNYSELVLRRITSNKYNFRIDHKINNAWNVFGRWSWRKQNSFEAPPIPGPSGSGANGFIDILNKQLVVGSTYAFKNASVLDLRFSWSKINAGKRPPLTGGPSMQDLYGITGLPSDPMITGGLTTTSIGGISQLGRQATNPQFQNPTNVDIRPTYTFLIKQHSFKVGYEYLAVNTDVQDTNPLMGLDTYGGQFSRPIGVTSSNNLWNLADFMFGARSQYDFATLTVAHMRQRFHFGYIQDDWKVNHKLTLNLGLRYEFGTPYWEKDNRLSNYDPDTNSIIMAKDGSLYDRGLVKPDYNNFSPRLGFAYNVFKKTVVRGGYAKGFVFMNRLGSADILGTNYPIVTRAAVAQNPTVSVGGVPTPKPLCTGSAFAGDCFRPTQNGYPTSGLPNNVTLYVPKDKPTASIQNWQVSIQQELMKDMVLDVAYVGNRSSDTVLLADLNQARPVTQAEWTAFQTGGTPLPSLDSRRPISGFGSISAVLPEGFSNYNALQVKLERRFSKGLYLLNSFTWSKAIDNGSQALEEVNGNSANPQDVHDFKADKSIGTYDQPFNNTTSFVWELPIGRGRWIGGDMNKIADAFVGGWILNGINTMTSGQPITFTYTLSGAQAITSNLPNFLGGINLRPNISCDPTNTGTRSDPTADYFNPSCFSNMALTPYAPFGNAGRSIARSDSYFNLDFAIQKDFHLPITEATKLQFRAEAFNLFNKTNFLAANSSVSQLTFNSSGQVTGTGSFGRITSTGPARQIQFALKITF